MFKPLCVLALISLLGCAGSQAPSQRQESAQRFAANAGWVAEKVDVPGFELIAFGPQQDRMGEELSVYIEGDGLAWLTPSRPSRNPTPLNPIGLRLAVAHPHGKAVYLGRPCQYVASSARGCDVRYWTHERFSPAVVMAMSLAIDRLKERARVRKINLVGYSGGGAIAVLVASQRNDVSRIVTVAGNLDTQGWTEWHALGGLTGSLNPADLYMRVAHIPQWHFVGSRDDNLPPHLARGYAARFKDPSMVKVVIEEDFTHSCCWAAEWPDLWTKHVR